MATRRYINGDVDFEEILSMRPRDRRARSKRIANGLLRRWRGMARALPARYRNAYLRSMQVDVSSDGTEVMLSLEPSPEDDTLVKSVEYGFGPGGVGTYGPYDMRKTLLKPTTKSIRYNKQGGMYLNVPMRMTTRAMRAMRGGNAAYKTARALAPTTRDGGATSWGDRLGPGLTPKIQPRGRVVPGIGYVPPHANAPTTGIYRMMGPGGRSTYTKFRTISENGKPWVHPGVRPRRFIRKLSRQVQDVVAEVG